jgi:hypothetical protein
MSTVVSALGALIVLVVLQDVFATVLFPGSGRGLVRKPVTRLIRAAFRAVGRWVHGQRRRNLLSYEGPTQIALTLAVWLFLLLLGWALIYAPALGESIVASSGPTDTSWSTAVYYSGFALTTLGTGDVVANSGGYRLLTIVEAGVGFLTFSMAITYFLSVYPNLTSRNSFGQGLHNRTGNTGDAVVLLARMADGEKLPVTDFMSSTAASLRHIYQTHRFYPVLRYFHDRDVQYALPRMLLTALDTATLVRTVLDPERYVRLIRSSALAELMDAANTLLTELTGDARGVDPRDERDTMAWRKRAAAAADQLAAAGLRVRADTDAAADEYVATRTGWNPRLRALAAAMLYQWVDIAPTGSCAPPTARSPGSGS